MEDIRLEVSGLYLDPNELTAPAGSLREALNVRIRRQNTVEPRPGFPLTAVSGASGGGRAVFTWDGQVYAVFGTELWHCDGSPTEVLAGSTSLAISSDAAFFAPMGRCGYVTTDNGVYRIATPGSSTAVLAGVAQGTPPLITAISGSGVANNEHVALRVLFSETVNQQLLVGAPSEPATYTNTSGGATAVSLQVPLPAGVTAGMTVQAYRTLVVATSSPVGDEMYLARNQNILSADVTAGFVTVTLLANPLEELGASLYTNETQEGILQAAYPPPEAKCIAWWKGMGFYGDITPSEDYVLTGDASQGALTSGIGSIGAQYTGDTTLGSPIITNLPPGHGVQVGVYATQGGIVSVAGASIPADARVIASGATTVTLDKNATASTVGVVTTFLEVLDVDGVEFINGALSDLAGLQFGSRQDLIALVASYTDVHFTVSDYVSLAYSVVWRSTAAFDISYISAAAGGTLIGLYGATPTSATVEDPIPSRVAWSKTLQPEAVPLLQYQDIGDWRAPVMRLIPTRDSLFVLKADGVWRITGDGPDSLRVEDFDRTLRLIHRRAADVFDNQVWAWTSNGVVAISEAGAQRMSEPAIGSALEASQENIITLGMSAPPGGCFIAGCTNQECVLVGVPSSTATGANATAEYVYVYEGKTGAWVRWQPLTGIGWRGAVEQKGDILLAGEAASLMYQDDDRTDAESAVTVTLAASTQATTASLGSDVVGYRITQGSVVAWLTAALGSAAYTTTATLANDAATAAAPMTCTVEWNAAATSGTMAHWRQMRAQFTSLAQAWRVLFGFTSERVQTLAEVYQDFAAPETEQGVTALRMLITRAQARCARLRPRITIASAGQRWLLNGITLTFEPMRDGNRLP